MNCYDCATNDVMMPAVAVCHDCGAGICADHATTAPHHLAKIVPLGRYVPIEPAARIIRCHTCSAATSAAKIA